jgi:hypothetical protein
MSRAALVDGGDRLAVQGRGLHGDPQWAGHRAADVEKEQRALVLLVRFALGGQAEEPGRP